MAGWEIDRQAVGEYSNSFAYFLLDAALVYLVLSVEHINLLDKYNKLKS